jgi:hypothetical protein
VDAVASAVGAAPSSAASWSAGHQASAKGDGTYTFAVIGDIPYGDLQIAQFPEVVDQINADPGVRLVDHLGDINADQPLAAGSPWLGFYGVPAPAGNLRRVTVDGSTEVADWLKVTIDPRDPAVLRWARMPFTG